MGIELLDLVLPRECFHCAATGRLLCDACSRGFQREINFPPVAPIGSMPVKAACRYGGVTRSLLLAHKERGQPTLAAPLGRALAAAIRQFTQLSPVAGVWLIPVPSGRGVDRRRGSRPLAEIVRVTAGDLRSTGWRVGVSQPAAPARRRVDQVGLSDVDRWRNLAAAMVARPFRLPEWMPILLVDDIVTSGATLSELDRAIRSVGQMPWGAAVIATASTEPRAHGTGGRTSVGVGRSTRRTHNRPATAPKEELS
jgi:predicted amidophosphoribosyltransferase